MSVIVRTRSHYTAVEIRLGNENLLKLVTLLDTADAERVARGEPRYSQCRTFHRCGTPACALGHWIAAFGPLPQHDADGDNLFALNGTEWLQVFGPFGCNRAKSAAQAAAYIRGFVAARQQVIAP